MQQGLNNASKYFKDVPPKQIDETEDKKSDNELEQLFHKFNGGFEDIDSWLKHEEFRNKWLNEKQERNLRKDNAQKAYKFSYIWAIFVGVIIILKGTTCIPFELEETEFLFVIGSLTSSILIFYTLVIKYLFGNGKGENRD